MSLVDSRTVLSLLFNEQADSLLPSDASGSVGDLAAGAGATLPDVTTDALTGHARGFVSADATAIASEDSSDALALTRGMSVIALLALDVDAQDMYGSDGTIAQRGEGTAGDALSWAIRLSVVDAATRAVKVYLEWETIGRSIVTDVGAELTWPADETLLVAAVREVIDGTLVCRYHINGENLTGDTNALDVASAPGGDVWVGGRNDGSTLGSHLDAVIDAIEIYSEAISEEELQLLWLRMSKDLPQSSRAIKALVPPGVYTTDEDSSIQRELTVQGVGVGVVRSFARRLRDFSHPANAWGGFLTRWETITKSAPKPGDTLATRRSRVSSFLGTVRGFAVTDIKAVLEETLGLASADIDILEFDNDFAPDFSSDPGGYIGDTGNVSMSFGGTLFSSVPTDNVLLEHGLEDGKAGWMIWPVAGEFNAWIAGVITVDSGSDPDTAGALMLGSRSSNSWLFWSKARSGALSWATYVAGTLSPWTTVATVANSTMHLRVRCLGGGAFELRHGTTAALADAATPEVISTSVAKVEWAGYVTTSIGSNEVIGDIDLSDFLIHAPAGGQRYNWYAYRDPALDGTPDMDGANLVIQRIKPAHTHAAAITQKTLRYDDTESGYDREPMGL